jgi:hypothetical protein
VGGRLGWVVLVSAEPHRALTVRGYRARAGPPWVTAGCWQPFGRAAERGSKACSLQLEACCVPSVRPLQRERRDSAGEAPWEAGGECAQVIWRGYAAVAAGWFEFHQRKVHVAITVGHEEATTAAHGFVFGRGPAHRPRTARSAVHAQWQQPLVHVVIFQPLQRSTIPHGG